MDIEVLLESFDGAFAPNTLRDYRKADNGRYQKIIKGLVTLGWFTEAYCKWRFDCLITPFKLVQKAPVIQWSAPAIQWSMLKQY